MDPPLTTIYVNVTLKAKRSPFEMRILRCTEDTNIFNLSGPIQTFYAPKTKQIRYRNPSGRRIFLEKGEISAQFNLVSETKGQDCKAINIFGSQQTVNNNEGFAIESQQRQDELMIRRDFLRRELQLNKNP